MKDEIAIICHDDAKQIVCPKNSAIRITKATFGRETAEFCQQFAPSHQHLALSSAFKACADDITKTVELRYTVCIQKQKMVREIECDSCFRCQGQLECVLEANTDQFELGKCTQESYVEPYLTVFYSCSGQQTLIV